MARNLYTTITFPSSLHNDRLIMRVDTPTGVTTFKVPADVNKSNFIAYMAKAGKPVRNADLRELPAECFEDVHKLKLVNCILPPLGYTCYAWQVQGCNVVRASAYGGEWEVILEYGKFKAELCKVQVTGSGQVNITSSTASIKMHDSSIKLTNVKARLRVEHSKCVFDNVVIMRDKYCKVPYIRYSLVDHVDSDLRKLHWLGALTGTVFSQNMWYRFDSVFLHIYTFKNEIYAVAGCHTGKLVNVVRQLVDYRRYKFISVSLVNNDTRIQQYESNLSVLAAVLQQTQLSVPTSVKASVYKAARMVNKADKAYQAMKAKAFATLAEANKSM